LEELVAEAVSEDLLYSLESYDAPGDPGNGGQRFCVTSPERDLSQG